MYYFTHQGVQDLRNTRESHRKRYQKLQEDVRSTDPERIPQQLSSRSDAETTPEHLDTLREIQFIDQQILQIDEMLRMAVVLETPADTIQLRIGHIATIQRFNLNSEKLGEAERYLVGGYHSNDPRANPPVLSYDAPVIASFLGKKVDPDSDPIEIYLYGKKIFVELLKIEMPSQASKLSVAA